MLGPRNQSPLDVPGLQLLAEAGRGARSTVYRALHRQRSVAVKLPRDPTTTPRLYREAAVLGCLRHRALPQVFEVGEARGQPYLIRQFVDAQPLARIIRKGPLAEDEVRHIGETLASALQELHRWGLVHRDLTPTNVLVAASTEIYLIDFEFATWSGPATDQAELTATLRYAAPEQTGLLHRPVDGRADLYALGVVMFECLTGVPPFQHADTRELLRMHAVCVPPDVRDLRPSVSPALAGIVRGLLAKDPDDRAAAGRDLVGAGRLPGPWAGWAELPFDGRAHELERLRQLLVTARGGRGTSLLVVGAPGSGKSRLLREFLRRHAEGACLLVGKAPSDGCSPLAPWQQALTGYLAQLSGEERAQAHDLLHRAAHGDDAVLARLVPGAFPEAGKAATQESQGEGMTARVLAELLLSLAEAAGLLVVCIDDVQWLDAESLACAQELARTLAQAPILFVATGRSDLASRPGCARFEQTVALAGSRLELSALPEQEGAALVERWLGGPEADPRTFARISGLAGGNPLRIQDLVRALLHSGQLLPDWGRWRTLPGWEERLGPVGGTETAHVHRLRQLSATTRQLLTVAACFGDRFDTELLRHVDGHEQDKMLVSLTEACAAAVIAPLHAGGYRFLHDLFREQLLQVLSRDARKALHQRVAEAWSQTEGRGAARVSAIAYHLVRGDVSAAPRRVLDALIQAGRQALADQAAQQACSFLAQAEALAREYGLGPDTALLGLSGDAQRSAGRGEEALQRYQQALQGASSPEARARLRIRRALLLTKLFCSAEALAEVTQAYAELRVPMVGRSLRSWAVSWGCWVMAGLARRWPTVFRRRWRQRSSVYRQRAELSEALTAAARGSGMPELSFQGLMRQLYFAQAADAPEQLLQASAAFVNGVAGMGRSWRVASNWQLVRRLARQLGHPRARAFAQLHEAWLVQFSGNDRHFEELCVRCLDRERAWLEPEDYALGCLSLALSLHFRGYVRRARSWLQRVTGSVAGPPGSAPEARWRVLASFQPAASQVLGLQAAALREREAVAAALAGLGVGGSERVFATVGLLAQALEDDRAPALRTMADSLERLLPPPSRIFFGLRGGYVLLGYARLRACMESGKAGRTGCLDRLRRVVRPLRTVACVPLFRSHRFVVEAGLHFLEGAPQRALDALRQAEEQAGWADVPWALFEAARLRAQIHTATGAPQLAARWWESARQIATDRGWISRLAQLSRHPQTEWPAAPAAPAPAVDPAEALLQSRLDSLVRVSLQAAGAPAERQTRTILDEMVRLLHAERGVLVAWQADTQNERFLAARDAQGRDLLEPEGYSRTVVRRVCTTGEGCVLQGLDGKTAPAAESVVAQGLRSIIASPLKLRGQTVGAVYLDSRRAAGVFGDRDLRLLQALGQHVAYALELARGLRQELAERIAANLPGMVFQLVERSGGWRFVHVSQGAEDLLDEPASRLEHNFAAFLQRLHPDDRTDFVRSLQEAAEAGSSWHWRGRTRQGTRWLEGRAHRDGGPGVCTWDGILLDVSERQRALEGLKQVQLGLEQSVQERTRQLSATVARLEQQERQLRALSNRLITVQEQERTRIAREIHDELGHALTSQRLELDMLALALPAGPLRQRAQTLAQSIVATAATVRRIAWELRPALLDQLGLDAALESELEAFAARTGLTARFRSLDLPLPLDPERDTALYRIAQEALTNVARHARASQVQLQLERADGAVVLRIEDDGVGFDAERTPTSSLGLTGMRERVRALAGSLRIAPGALRGTVVEASVPSRRPGSAP